MLVMQFFYDKKLKEMSVIKAKNILSRYCENIKFS